MTINEYMSNLELESMTVANEMACDAMLCDFYSSYADDDESSVANESIDLAFDDEDDAGFMAEPATEAGFFKTLGNKFKSVIETVKGWFEKVASTIKSWITKFVDRIKSKVSAAKNKRQAMKIAGIQADADSATKDLATKMKELTDREDELTKQANKETNASKKQNIIKELMKIKNQKEALAHKGQEIYDKAAIGVAKVFAQRINEGITKAENAFKIACKDHKTIEDIMVKIASTKVSPKNKKSKLVSELDDDKLPSALKKVPGAENMRRDLEKMLENLNKVEDTVTNAVAAVDEAKKEFDDTLENESTKLKVLSAVNLKLPSNQLVAKATFMAKECEGYASEASRLAGLFGDAPAEDSNEKDKRPEIAKALSAYSNVASKLVKIANAYLSIANKGELVVVCSEEIASNL